MNYPDGTKNEIFSSCGSFCSNYVAEQLAISTSVTHINHTFDTNPLAITNIVIFTDSLSTIQALENGTEANKEMIQLSRSIHHLINSHRVQIVLQWIPGHAGLPGNEKADELAKRGASLPQPETPVSYQTACQMIKSNLREEWMNSWALETKGRHMYSHMTKPNRKDPINKLQREDQSIIFRLRTRHIPLNSHLKRINVKTSAACPLCNHPDETVEHHLFDCINLKELRGRFLPSKPNIHKCLYGTTEQMKKTCSFFKLASGERAQAHVPLVR